MSEARPAAFLDRDGVLNVDHGYVHRLDQLDLIAGAAEAVRLLNEAGFLAIVVTNQSGVARGLYGEDDVKRFNTALRQQFAAAGARIDAVYYCPHHPQGTVARYAIACGCRKPKPGLLEQAARDFASDRARSFMIGDKDDDREAAAAFGIRGIKFDAATEQLVDVTRRAIAGTPDRPAGVSRRE
jgi:D-glycero-D-manno-heptose 1,7-bisphosphate phosphatase